MEILINLYYYFKSNFESLLPNKESFYSNLNLENISDSDYRHVKKP